MEMGKSKSNKEKDKMDMPVASQYRKESNYRNMKFSSCVEESNRRLMASATAATTATDPHPHHGIRPNSLLNNLSRFFQSTANNLSTILSPKTPPPPPSSSPPKVILPPPFPDSSLLPLHLPLACSYSPSEFSGTQQPDSQLSSSSAVNNMSSKAGGHGGFPSTVRVSGLNSTKDRSGPAFVGQVFSMCDLSGTGLMAVSTHFDVPFLSKRTPEWLKKMFAAITKSERNGPVFRFFLDLGDAVSYVKQLNIPSGVVGACRLDLAYEHFKEKPHLFQFVPNEKQVKEANKLLKMMPQNRRKKKVEGVPVFSAENLDIAIATTDGIKWYTPYFFDKSTLDNILEESVDQHFHSLIQTRNVQRRREIVDDNLAAEVVEEMGDSMWEPPEVQEVIDEMGHPGIPLSVLSKAAEIQLLYCVDKVLLGNRWLRKATGIQPKFPYIVDSFEKRSTASFLRACKSSNLIGDSNLGNDSMPFQCLDKSEDHVKDTAYGEQGRKLDFRLPFKDWLALPWLKEQQKLPRLEDKKEGNDIQSRRQQLQSSLLLPKITMVGISTGEAGQMNKATLKKTMEDLTKELERMDPSNPPGTVSNELKIEERDPLFVANIGDYLRTGSARLVRREAN